MKIWNVINSIRTGKADFFTYDILHFFYISKKSVEAFFFFHIQTKKAEMFFLQTEITLSLQK